MENEFGFEILGWCNYCHEGIYIGDPYSVDEKGNMYHPECKEQKETCYDPFNLEE